MALILGGLINIIGMIVLPVYQANQGLAIEPGAVAEVGDDELPAIPNLMERLDTTKIQWGAVLLILDTGVIIFLTTGVVGRHFASRRLESVTPLEL